MQTNISMCVCNTNIPEVLHCEDDQKTIVIKVKREGVTERERRWGGGERSGGDYKKKKE